MFPSGKRGKREKKGEICTRSEQKWGVWTESTRTVLLRKEKKKPIGPGSHAGLSPPLKLAEIGCNRNGREKKEGGRSSGALKAQKEKAIAENCAPTR